MPSKSQKISQYNGIIQRDSRYQKLPIDPQLNSYVKSIEIELISENNNQNELSYRVLPDLSVVMGFQYRGSLYLLEENEKKRLDCCGISGLQTQHKIYSPENIQTKTLLIKLYPWAINTFFNEGAYRFTNHALGLSEILDNSPISCLKDQLAASIESKQLSHLVQTFLLDLLAVNKGKLPPSPIIALAKQLSNFERIASIAQLAKDYGLSKRNLERQFKNAIGLSPKKFLQLSKFQKTLYQLRKGVSWEQIVDQLHYYDQAHFINSFKEFTGLTPSQFRKF